MTSTPAVWIDGDPLMEAIAAAVYEQCGTDPMSSIVVDDPRNIAAVAATVARQVFDATTAAAAPEPKTPTEEQIVREHVTTVHLIGEQLTAVESYLWERLADIRTTKAADEAKPTPNGQTPAGAARCNTAVLGDLGASNSQHAPHNWEPQPGMTPVRCPGTTGRATEKPATDLYVNGVCPFGENHATGAGCINPMGHTGPHYVTPGDVDG
jgi:hypothetical protein